MTRSSDLVMVEREKDVGVLRSIGWMTDPNDASAPRFFGAVVQFKNGDSPKLPVSAVWNETPVRIVSALQSVEGGVQGSIATKQESRPESAPRTETAGAIYSALSSACIEHSALSVSGFNLFGDSKSIKAAQEWLHSHSQIGDLKTNLRHWRDECGKLHAQLTKTPSADVCDAGVEQTWDKCPECGASPNDLCGRVFSPVDAETNANAPGDTNLVSGASAEPNHHQPHALSQGWRDDLENAPHNVPVLLAWQDWRDGQWCMEIGPAIMGQRYANGHSSISHHGSATHWQPRPAPPSPETTPRDSSESTTGGAE